MCKKCKGTGIVFGVRCWYCNGKGYGETYVNYF